MSSDAIEARIRNIVGRILHVSDGSQPSGDFPLLGDDGVFDSVIALELVLALENEFGIVVMDNEVGAANLKNIDSMIRFVGTKIGLK